MPANRVSDVGITISRSDVVGADSASERQYISHVALSEQDVSLVKIGDSIDTNHMGPPLQHGYEMEVHVHATADLSDDELNQIQLFIDEHHNEQEAQQRQALKTYVIHPHAVLSEDGSFRRFSCAGYVVEAYEEAGINLIDMEYELPLVNLDSLMHAYEGMRLENHPQLRALCGLSGEGPWPVLLPGYIFHSMVRQTAVIKATPYQPTAGDEKFPRD